MKVSLIRTLIDYAVFSLSILLVFLTVFEAYLELPRLAAWLGHFHPLVLHLPIALVFIAIIQYWRKDPQVYWYISVTALLCLVTSITGTMLSVEGGSEGGLINSHQWFGIGVTTLMVIWHYGAQLSMGAHKILQPLLVIGILVTGHLGGSVTHGEDFLSFKGSASEDLEALPDNPELFAYFVQPILDRKCVSCHNANKSKGGLMMTSFAALVEGGENGSALDPSTGIKYHVYLPLEDEDHMPPKNEDQLTQDEMSILSVWLEGGALEKMTFADLDTESDAYALVAARIEESQRSQWTDLPTISDSEIESLNGDYATVLRKYHEANALQALIFPYPTYDGRELRDLQDVDDNVVELNLSNLPVSREDLEIVASFSNLTSLDLHGAQFDPDHLGPLSGLDNLQVLKVYGTDLDDNWMKSFQIPSSLRDLYVYQTRVSQEATALVQDQQPGLKIHAVASQASDFRTALTIPELEPRSNFFREPFYVRIDYPMDGIDFRYTLDGSDPDENSSLLTDSLLIDRDMTVKLFAAKEGWERSPIDSVAFMRSKVLPARMTWEYPPATAYEGTPEELFDLKKGSRQFADGPWMAFQDNPLILTCELAEATEIQEAVFSTLSSSGPYIFPPWQILVYGGDTVSGMRLLHQMRPPQLTESSDVSLDYYTLPLAGVSVKYLKFHVDPIPRLPSWHPAAGEPGWLFIDEIVLR